MTPGNCPSWHHPRIILTLLIVFLGGVSAGMLTMSLGVHRWMHRTAEAAPFSHEGGKESTVQRFRSELDLTPAQTEQLELILDDYFTYYATVQAQLDDVRASGKHKLLRLLNDDQKRRFERLMAELQEKQKLR